MIQPPKPGSPLRASWAQQITERVNQMSAIGGAGLLARDGAGGFGFAALPANQRDRRGAARPMPFEVRFDATLNSNAGGWKIYLPTEHLLSCDGTDIDTSDISGATPIQDANGDDTAWCSLAGIGKNDDHVWLVVTIPSEDSSSASASETATPTAEFSAEEEESEDENTRILNICIAEVSYTAPSGQGVPPTVEIKQSVIGALHLGGGKDGDESVTPDDVSTEFIPDPPQGQSPTGDEGKLQIKGWDKGLPRYYSIAQLINGSSSSNLRWNRVPIRLYQAEGDTPAGGLVYADIGTLAQLLGSTINKTNQKILTGLSWDTTYHKLVISSATVNIANGVITSWTDNNDEDIETTAISSIIN